MKKKIDLLIFTEASSSLGHGHVMRCKALADEAREQGINVGFFTQDKYMVNILQSLEEDSIIDFECNFTPRFVIRDFKNGSSLREVQRYLSKNCIVLLLDELGQSRAIASLVSDVFMTSQRSLKYPHSENTKYLYGLNYAPLKKQFSKNHGAANPGSSIPGRLLVSFGGSDPFSITKHFIEALNYVGFCGPATVVASKMSPDFNHIEEILCGWKESEILDNVTDMSLHMKYCDIAVTKLGMIMLEAFCIGLGCITIEPTPAHLALQMDQALFYNSWPVVGLGLANELDFFKAAHKTMELLHNPNEMSMLAQQGANLVDGLGAKRIIEELLMLERENCVVR
ncbi:MAG TPA: hypothetical protein ENN38_06490 [Actinobacteria bacterium]|nr:hypothetical protein [Actinomycetota bacterium]